MKNELQQICERVEFFRDKEHCGVKASRYVADADYLIDEITKLKIELREKGGLNAEREIGKSK